ncbi:unnamed protein product [Allacma fusca]|uniref:Uncharacterized protein n=1 Tax=Allacma fusca TaxID=39272 RepID=A0A8J2LGR5_9HEXA|nr:unnamed protein product [Allacma fusca]
MKTERMMMMCTGQKIRGSKGEQEIRPCLYLYKGDSGPGSFLTPNTCFIVGNSVFKNSAPNLKGVPASLIVTSPRFISTWNLPIRYSRECSIVVYLASLIHPRLISIKENWVSKIPGSYFKTFHFIFEANITENYWEINLLRRLSNAVVLRKTSEFSVDTFYALVPNRFRETPNFFQVGTISSRNNILEFSKASESTEIFWNKWKDLQGRPLRMAGPIPQPEKHLTAYRQNGVFKFVTVIFSETADMLNATPKGDFTDISRGFGSPSPNGTFTSYIGKLHSGEVDMTASFMTFPFQFLVILQSKPVTMSPLVFFAPLPKKEETSSMFLLKPFDLSTWLAILFSVVTNTAVLYAFSVLIPSSLDQHVELNWLGTIHFLIVKFVGFVKIMIDQPISEKILTQERSSSGMRILFLFWLLSMIVVVNMYKSTVISVLVEPIYIKSPLTVEELLKSDFQLNFILYKAFHFEKRLPWVKQLKHPVQDYGINFPGCLKSLVEGNNVCLFTAEYLYLFAPDVLVDPNGKVLFVASKDALYFTTNSFGVSQLNPQLKAALDRAVDVIIEAALDKHWIQMEFYQKSLKTIRRKKNDRTDILEDSLVDKELMLLPISILLVGFLLSICLLASERLYVYYYRRRQKQRNNGPNLQPWIESNFRESIEKHFCITWLKRITTRFEPTTIPIISLQNCSPAAVEYSLNYL